MVVPGIPACSILKPSSLLAVKKAFTVVVYVMHSYFVYMDWNKSLHSSSSAVPLVAVAPPQPIPQFSAEFHS